VGIRERHVAEEGMATSDMAVEAAKRCLDSRGIVATDVEAIVVATVTPDMLFLATACPVQDKLGAKGAWGFDLSAACSGFVYALQIGAELVESGSHSKVLVIEADTMSSIVDYTDRATCVLFGDGAGAVLIEPAENNEIGLIDFPHEIDGSGAGALTCRAVEACIPRRRRRSSGRRRDGLNTGSIGHEVSLQRAQETPCEDRLSCASKILASREEAAQML
jgi:3-oxoacyl-[acyl-carrier-protein] synthase III